MLSNIDGLLMRSSIYKYEIKKIFILYIMGNYLYTENKIEEPELTKLKLEEYELLKIENEML